MVGVKRVYVVHGAPYAGKKTYVNTVATRNDIVVDLDAIHRAICVCEPHDKPDATKGIAFNIRDMLLDHIRTATMRRKWQDAYIIGTYPDTFDRDRLVKEYGAELRSTRRGKSTARARNLYTSLQAFAKWGYARPIRSGFRFLTTAYEMRRNRARSIF